MSSECLSLSDVCALCSQLDCSLCSSRSSDSPREFPCCALKRSELDLDLRQHTYHCFPAKMHKDHIKGRFVVATRHIRKGELIFQEKPLLTGPDPSISNEHMPLCLGCYKQVTTGYKCSVCQWPMCDNKCEKLVQHSDFECQILASRKVPGAKNPIHYFFVNVLRCLLLREMNPSQWEKLLRLVHHEKFRLKQTKRKRLLGFVFTCFQIILKSPPSDGNVISQILGAIELNAQGFSDEDEKSGFFRAGQFLFYNLSLLSHDCVPNAAWVKVNESEPPGTFSAKLVAAMAINEGDVISINYTYPMKNTFDRRTYLKEGYFFTCNCNRCSDPTEFGTYFSAVKCPTKKCPGYLLPPAPTEIQSYKCNKCGLLKDGEFLAQIEEKILAQYSALELNPSVRNLNKIKDFVEANAGKSLHPNNEMILDAKEEMLTMMAKMPNRSPHFIIMQITLCENILQVMQKICPGLIFARGTMLECLFEAKIKLLLTASTSPYGGNVLTSKMLNEIKTNKKRKTLINNEGLFLRHLIKIGEEASEIHGLNPLNEEKVAKIEAKLKWLKEAHSVLADDYCTFDNSEYDISKEPVYIIPVSKEAENYEMEPVAKIVSNSQSDSIAIHQNVQTSFLKALGRINSSKFLIAVVIICAVIYEIQYSYSNSAISVI